jgi:hypothetical protein
MAIKELFQDLRPQVLFDPRASRRIDPRFKFTRDAIGTYVNKEKYIAIAQPNEPRFTHDSETGEFYGLLNEPLAENSVTNSAAGNQILNNGIGSAAIVTNVVTPYGYQSECRNVIHGSAGVPGSYRVGGSVDIVQGLQYTVSCFVRNPNNHFFEQSSSGVFLGLHLYRQFTAQNASLGFGSTAMKKERFPNYWTRYSATFTAQDTATVDGYFHVALNSPTYFNWNYQLWGFQIEQNPYSTSYIPTSGITVTRAADLLSIEGATLPSEGSIYINARTLGFGVDETLLSAANASDDKITLAIRQHVDLYNSKALVYEVDGAFKPTLPFPVPTDARERNLITYGANNYHYRSDSARYTPSFSTSVPANMTRFGIGHDVTDPSKTFNGCINAVYLWPGEITPTVAEALVRGTVDPKNADNETFEPAIGSLAFIFNTQGAATDGDLVVQLPLLGSTNNVLVDWGDNASSRFIGAAASSTVSHTYPAAGIYPVQITADDDGTNSGLENLQFYNNSPADLVRVLQWGGTTTWQPTTMYRVFRDCTQLDFEDDARINLPDTSAITNWQEAFYNCSSLSGAYPNFDHSAATNVASAWYNCSAITTFSSSLDDLSLVTNYANAWYGCSSITSFPTITIPTDQGAVNLDGAWRNCINLESFPAGITTSAVTSIANTWQDCSSLESFPLIDTAAVTNMSSAWQNCSSLDNVTNGGQTTSFPLINTSSCTSFYATWIGCSSFTVFPSINTAASINFSRTWESCSSLTSFPALNFDLAVGLASDGINAFTGFERAWQNCTSLATFPPNLFDNTTSTRYLNAFSGCALTAASIENIIVSIEAAGTSNGNLSLQGGTNAGASTWTANAVTAYNALVARGWTITRNA